MCEHKIKRFKNPGIIIIILAKTVAVRVVGCSIQRSEGDQSRQKLPAFDEHKDDMNAYLRRYEWFATSQEWDMGDWAVSPSPLLTEKGQQVYCSMPPGDANYYEKLKTALLQQYELTEEGFHWKFREKQPEVGETVFSVCSTAEKNFQKMD